MNTTAWTSICDDIASLHLAAESFTALPREHQPELLDLMRLSTERLTKRLSEIKPVTKSPIAAACAADQVAPINDEAVAYVAQQVAPVSDETAACAAEQVPRKIAATAVAKNPFKSSNTPLDESQKRLRRRRPKRTPANGAAATVAILTEHERCEGRVIDQSESGMGVTIAFDDTPKVKTGQNIRIVHLRRLRLARVVRILKDSKGRFELGVKWI